MARARKREQSHLIKAGLVTRAPFGKVNKGSVDRDVGRLGTRSSAWVHATGQNRGFWEFAGMKIGTPSWKVSPFDLKSHMRM